MKNYMTYDIGGTAIKSSIIREDGNILVSDKLDVPETLEEFIQLISEHTNNKKNIYDLKGIAISAPGAVDGEKGVIGGYSAIPYIHGPNFKEIFYNNTKLPIEIENDANCAALGECWLGVSKDTNDSLFVVCGTGIGGAIIKDKKIHLGAHHHGGEIGFSIVGYEKDSELKYPYWSDIGSMGGLVKRVAERKGIKIKELNGIEVFKMAQKGDVIAIEEIDSYYRYMAIGIYNMQYIYDPEIIVLGGAISTREDYIDKIYEKIDDIMGTHSPIKLRPIIKRCLYGNDANKIGALYNFLTKQNIK